MGMDSLKEHCIKEIRTFKVRSRYTRTIGRNSRIGYHGNGPDSQVRAIITDRGAVGWGLSWTPEEKMPDLVGVPIAELFDPEVGVIVESAMPLDFALHDLAGVIMGKAVYQMLGGKGEQIVPCYDGAIYMDDLTSPHGIAKIIENCQKDYDMGYRDFKLKIGRGYQWMDMEEGFRRDVEVTRAVSENFPECRILVDANDSFTCDGIIRFLNAVADCNIFWIEEPFRENRDDLIRLKEFLAKKSPNTLIADGEGGWNIDFLLKMADEKLLDVLQMDICALGFTAWRRIMPELAKMSVSASPHTWGDPLKTFYTAQLAAGLGNVITVEGIPSVTYGANVKLYKLEDGMLSVPDSPGFGIPLHPRSVPRG